MKVIITKGLLQAIERAAVDAKRDAESLPHNADYKALKEDSSVKLIVDRNIEQTQQDYDAIMGWAKRIREEHKIKD